MKYSDYKNITLSIYGECWDLEKLPDTIREAWSKVSLNTLPQRAFGNSVLSIPFTNLRNPYVSYYRVLREDGTFDAMAVLLSPLLGRAWLSTEVKSVSDDWYSVSVKGVYHSPNGDVDFLIPDGSFMKITNVEPLKFSEFVSFCQSRLRKIERFRTIAKLSEN